MLKGINHLCQRPRHQQESEKLYSFINSKRCQRSGLQILKNIAGGRSYPTSKAEILKAHSGASSLKKTSLTPQQWIKT
ncbi:hypothetical protein DPMN_102938 [Dreissena polymorpha]|uniref:Uncharacterized protein n=1 Tax=Dreissena polymorpha TaxID=45954 RepID=A0A9D4H8Z1_DREPO|nr:hypothetical protein DPMN_102938 [Dreissena polymorpha]